MRKDLKLLQESVKILPTKGFVRIEQTRNRTNIRRLWTQVQVAFQYIEHTISVPTRTIKMEQSTEEHSLSVKISMGRCHPWKNKIRSAFCETQWCIIVKIRPQHQTISRARLIQSSPFFITGQRGFHDLVWTRFKNKTKIYCTHANIIINLKPCRNDLLHSSSTEQRGKTTNCNRSLLLTERVSMPEAHVNLWGCLFIFTQNKQLWYWKLSWRSMGSPLHSSDSELSDSLILVFTSSVLDQLAPPPPQCQFWAEWNSRRLWQQLHSTVWPARGA